MNNNKVEWGERVERLVMDGWLDGSVWVNEMCQVSAMLQVEIYAKCASLGDKYSNYHPKQPTAPPTEGTSSAL